MLSCLTQPQMNWLSTPIDLWALNWFTVTKLFCRTQYLTKSLPSTAGRVVSVFAMVTAAGDTVDLWFVSMFMNESLPVRLICLVKMNLCISTMYSYCGILDSTRVNTKMAANWFTSLFVMWMKTLYTYGWLQYQQNFCHVMLTFPIAPLPSST